jgi:hypothetical protein
VFQLSWILPGKIYPVIEPVKGPGTLHGQGLVEGFDSHYILTDGTVPIPLSMEDVQPLSTSESYF